MHNRKAQAVEGVARTNARPSAALTQRPRRLEPEFTPASAHWRPDATTVERVLVVLLAAVWVWLLAPAPAYFVHSAETGHQLAGAWNLLHAGQWLHVDYVTAYGPARYWVSALGLLIGGDGLFGELLTRSVGYAVYLVVLQHLLRRVSDDAVVAWLLLVIAALALPPSHKYWTALCPVLALGALYRCCTRPAWSAWVGLGSVLGLATLFRPDYGLFALSAVVAALLPSGLPQGRLRAAAGLAFGAALLLVPWLLWLGLHRNVLALFLDWAAVGSATGEGLSLPHPLVNWRDPLLSLAFLVAVAVPVLGLVRAAVSKHPLRGMQRFSVAVHVFALVNLVQSSHRADWPHLLQGTVPLFVSAALLWHTLPRRDQWARVALVAVLGVVGAGQILMPGTPAQAVQNWRAASLSKAEFERQFLQADPLGRLSRLAQACVPVATPTAFYPFAPQLHYFAERPFAAGLPFLAPGLFASAQQQAKAVAVLQAQAPTALFWNEDYSYDNQPARNGVNTHAVLHAFVEQHYVRAAQVDGFTVFLRPGEPSRACATALAELNTAPL